MQKFTGISFDLGAELGFSKVVVTLGEEIKVEVVGHGTIYLDTLTEAYMRKENPRYSRHRVKMNIFEAKVRTLLKSMCFQAFIVEDVYLKKAGKFPLVDAYRSLTIYLDTLDRIVTNEFGSRLDVISASAIKKHISGYGGADKMQVQDAILNNPRILIPDGRPLTQHSADSIAGAYGFAMKTFYSAI